MVVFCTSRCVNKVFGNAVCERDARDLPEITSAEALEDWTDFDERRGVSLSVSDTGAVLLGGGSSMYIDSISGPAI